MNSEMAYLFGLIIGGGTITSDSISIEFPYKRWPHEDFEISPTWFNDSMKSIVPAIKRMFNADAIPRYVPGDTPRFYINITEIPEILYEMLRLYDIKPVGELRRHVSIKKLVLDMDEQCKREFVSGLADVIGSCRASHRHRSSASTIISFEIIGENWDLPFELCQLLHELGVPVDQILWHHPNMHAGSNPTAYWKKGHKVRVKAGDFASIGYGLECKRKGLARLLEIEKEYRGSISHGSLCPDRIYRINRRKVVHLDEHSEDLPEKVRGHFIHYTHICDALGCPYAPKEWLSEMVKKYGIE